MKITKSIIVVTIIAILCLSVNGAKRRPPKPMNELTNPNSPSYVPFPYPKNRKEIIANLMYYAEHFCAKANVNMVEGGIPSTHVVLTNLLEPQSNYEIGKIIKVKNRTDKQAHDYSWLILIMNAKGELAMRAAMDANGLYAGASAFREETLDMVPRARDRERVINIWKLKTDDDVKEILADTLSCTVVDLEIKKMQRVAYLYTSLGDFIDPLWEFIMKDGTVYYYSRTRDAVYSIDKKIPWKKKANGRRDNLLKTVPNFDYLPDSINDEWVVLKKVQGKKKY